MTQTNFSHLQCTMEFCKLLETKVLYLYARKYFVSDETQNLDYSSRRTDSVWGDKDDP